VIRELVPLERLIIVDIDLPEQFNQVLHQACCVSSVWQVVQHYLDELVHGQAVFLLHEIFFNFLQLSVVQVSHDVGVFLLVIFRLILGYNL
jgi:hypothetical protein